MMRLCLVLSLLAAMTLTGQCRTVKRKRDSGAMVSDFISDDYNAVYPAYLQDDYSAPPARVEAYYDVKYDKKFNEKWLDQNSAAFAREARKVSKILKRKISRDLNVLDTVVEISVDNFIPGSTRAQVRIIVDDPSYTVDDITQLMTGLVASNFQIGRAAVLEVTDLNTPLPPEGQQASGIVFELTYEKDIRSQSEGLNDTRSRDFEVLASAIKSQIELLLVEPLQDTSGQLITPDMMDTTVLKISPDGALTKAEIEMHVAGIPVDLVSEALLTLTDANRDLRIDGGLIIGADELTRVFDEGSGFPLPGGPDYALYSYDEEEPDEGMAISEEVMSPKETDPIEPAEEVAPSRGDGAERTPPPLPTDPVASQTEPTPPPPKDKAEPTPPGNCPTINAPKYGSMDCRFGSEIGSTCQFTCNPDTKIIGTDTIQCGLTGSWNEDPPYCIRLFCQPMVVSVGNGSVSCTNDNHYRSDCEFLCDSGFTLSGESSISCSSPDEWSSPIPTCEMDPVNCEEEYGPWSQCANGQRVREEVLVARGSIFVSCPAVTEVCIDCELEWGEWTECVDGSRRRVEVIKQSRAGAGKECSTPNTDRQDCVQCQVGWGEWSECVSEIRSRSQIVTVEPVGYECPDLQAEEQECLPCVTRMGSWGFCENGFASRIAEIVRQPTNGGTPCPSNLQEETTACRDCEVEWTEWSKCTNGTTTRSTVVVIQPEGVGEKCPKLQTEESACADCVVEWSDWSPCEGGQSTRQQIVTQEQSGEGKICPELEVQNEDCADCVLQWGDWGPCVGALSHRVQFVMTEKYGPGSRCLSAKDDYRVCANCNLEWNPWSECDGTSRKRTQRMTQHPVNVEEPCPQIQEEVEPCRGCSYEWSEWSVCDFGSSTRTLTILNEPIGAGDKCPVETTQTKDCCFLVWGDWSECQNGTRIRMEEVLNQPEGEICADGEMQEEDCSDCVVEWGEWSECTNNFVTRQQFVKQPADGGKPCPDLLLEDADSCANCKLDWGPWRECAEGERTRQQYILAESEGLGEACPDLLKVETEECYHCDSRWGEWSECRDGQRERTLEVAQEAVGAGNKCPSVRTETEACRDCVLAWTVWTTCSSGSRTRNSYIRSPRIGAGKECEELETETEDCVDCKVGWGEWSECADGKRQRSQVILVTPIGAGVQCPKLQTVSEDCVDCVVEWGPWNACFGGTQRRSEIISVRPVGVGDPCPAPLRSEERACKGNATQLEEIICRFVGRVLGYRGKPTMRDLLLIADESGSIGRFNYDKIKINFKSIVDNIQGGIGSQETQISMLSFASASRVLFDFDDHTDTNALIAAIDKTYYRGGYTSEIGYALAEANYWVFQQTAGMRSFPNIDDNIEHEILIATDGCRTTDFYSVEQGLKTIRRRGIKLYVLGIASQDERCRKTIDAMVDDKNDLFMLGSWDELDELSQRIDEGVCQVDVSGTIGEEDKEIVVSGEGSGSPPESSRGDSGDVTPRFRRDTSSNYMLGDFE